MADPAGEVPPGRYAEGRRSPSVWVMLCDTCAGYAPLTPDGYHGALSGSCHGCGTFVRERHRFVAWLDTMAGCGCQASHVRVRGDVGLVYQTPPGQEEGVTGGG